MKPRLTEIRTLDTRTEQQKKIDAIKSDVPVLIELAKATSEIAWTQFQELTNQGFTEAQAIQILIGQPIWK